MDPSNERRIPPRPEAIPLRILRIDSGSSLHARMLSERCLGLFTHWVKSRSSYCEPNVCCTGNHRADRFWKGYVAAEVYEVASGRWVPWCLEVTEHLELDFRGRYARGQVWRVWRLPVADKKRRPVQAELVEELDPATLPKAFAIEPVLRTVFHHQGVVLDQKNPMPDRVILSASEGQPPPGIGSRAPKEEPPCTIPIKELARRLDLSQREKLTNGIGAMPK